MGGASQCRATEIGEAEAITIAIDQSEEKVDGGYRIGQAAYSSDYAIDPHSCCSVTRERHVVTGEEVWQVVIETPVRLGTAVLLVNIDSCGEKVDSASMLTPKIVER